MDWLFPDRWLWPWAFALLLVPLLLLWFRGRLHGGPGFLFSSTAVLERIGRRVRERAGRLRLLFPLAALAASLGGDLLASPVLPETLAETPGAPSGTTRAVANEWFWLPAGTAFALVVLQLLLSVRRRVMT
jgi:hypothetical protein